MIDIATRLLAFTRLLFYGILIPGCVAGIIEVFDNTIKEPPTLIWGVELPSSSYIEWKTWSANDCSLTVAVVIGMAV